MAEATTYNNPKDSKDKKPKWNVQPFDFNKVKKSGTQDKQTTQTIKTTAPVKVNNTPQRKTEPVKQEPVVNNTQAENTDPKLGMGDLKQAENEGTVNFFDQQRPRNINDLYQTPQESTKAPEYNYKKLEKLPITKKTYKQRTKDPQNREPTYPIPEAVETESGSYVPEDIEPVLQAQEIKQKTDILNKINNGEINLPPFVSSLPVDMQLSYVGATYNNNPVYTALTTLMEPLLHLDNLVRSGMNKAFNTDYKMLTPPQMEAEDEDNKLVTGGTELLTALIPLGASIKGANYLLKGVNNPFLRNILGTGLGFVINSQPAYLDNLSQGNMELKEYAKMSAVDFATGLSFGLLPHGTAMKYMIPYQSLVPTMVPVISDLIEGKGVNEEEIIHGIISNAVLGLVMGGQLPKETKVKEVTRQVQTELKKYDESQQTPEVMERILKGLLLEPGKVGNSETITRVKPGQKTTTTEPPSRLGKIFGREGKTTETVTKPELEQVTIPGDRSRIIVDENGKARLVEEKDAESLLLSKTDIELQRDYGMTPEEISRAKENLNTKVYPDQPQRREAEKQSEKLPEDVGTKPEKVDTPEKRVQDTPQPVKEDVPTKISKYKTERLSNENYGEKYITDAEGTKFIVKKITNDGRQHYEIYKKSVSDPEPVRHDSKYFSEHSVNLGLRSLAEGDMKLSERPADKKAEQKTNEKNAFEKKAEDAYSDMLELRDEVNNVKASDLGGRANKNNNIRLLKKAVDTYNNNHPDNTAKIERTKYGRYNITINGKPLRRESVKREYDVETEASKVEDPNANKPYKELGEAEREAQRRIAADIESADPRLVKEKAKFETPLKTLRQGLKDIQEDSGKEQSPEAKIVREEMLEKTDNGRDYRDQREPEQKRQTVFEKMSLPEIERHINDKAKEMGSRADYLRSAEYKELIKPVQDRLLKQQTDKIRDEVKGEKEKLDNKIITKDQYDQAINNIKERGKNMYTTPIDLAALKDMSVVGLYHLEKGLRTFKDWSIKMVKELGEKIKPHLKKLWQEIQNPKNTRIFNEKNPQGMVTQGYAGRTALGYEKAKEEGKVFKNPYDKKERFEIDDSKAKLANVDGGFFTIMYDNLDFKKNPTDEYYNPVTLQDLLHHTELYKNYPRSKNITIVRDRDPKGPEGSYNSQENTITIKGTLKPEKVKSVLLHEIQHAIQHREGFARGGNADMFKKVNSLAKDFIKEVDDILLTKIGNSKNKQIEEYVWDYLGKKITWEELLQKSYEIIPNDVRVEILHRNKEKSKIGDVFEKYKLLAGEIEARDVQARMDLTAEQRDPNHPEYVAPYSSENIAPQDAILRYDSNQSNSMKLKEKDGESETFEQYKKRIAKEYGTVPTREEYNDAKQLQITNDKLQSKQDKSDVKTELENTLDEVINGTDKKQPTLDEMRSRTSKKRKYTAANEEYMDKVFTKIDDIKKDMEKKGYKGQALLNLAEIESINKVLGDPEFKKFKASQKKAIVREIKNHYKEEYRKRTAANAVLGEEYQDKNVWHELKNNSFIQILTHLGRQGESGKEMVKRFRQMADEERRWMGEPSGLLLDIEGLSKAERHNLEKIWEAKMNEQTPQGYMNDNVKNVDVKINEYFDKMAGEYSKRGFVTRNLLTGDIYKFTPRKDYRPRLLNDKIRDLKVTEDNAGVPKPNAAREKIIDHLVETRQAKDRAGAAILLDNEISKHIIRKAGNVEYSRTEEVRLPDEYYETNPSKSLLNYAKKVSKRVAFVDAWGMESQIFNRLRDDMYKQGGDYERANDLFKYETGQLTVKERKQLYRVNDVKALMALTKFSPFTTLRNTFQGFLGTTTRGNLKAGITGLIKSLDPNMKKHAYEAGVMADNLEGIFKDTVGHGNDNFLSKLTTRYLDIIKFSATDRYNRVISGVGGLTFMEDMLKRIQKDSVWKKRAHREFDKLGLDPDKVIKNGGFTKEQKDKIMRTFAFDSQFSLRPQDLPVWWSSPTGKLVTQWKPWGFKMTQLIRDNIVAELKNGNPMPIVTMLTAYGISGEVANYIIDSVRSVASFNPKSEKYETPNERSLIGKIKEGDIGGTVDRIISDLAGLGAFSLYWDIVRSFGYGKLGEGLSVLMGPAYSELSAIASNLFGPITKKLAMASEDDWEEVTKKTIKGLFKSTAGNVPGAGTFRSLGMTKALEDYLFKKEVTFKEDSTKGEYYNTLDDAGKEEMLKIRDMEKEVKDMREEVLKNPSKEMQKKFQQKEAEVKKYKAKSRVWYEFSKIKKGKEQEDKKKLGK
jgi:hypothetical protein